MFPGAPAHPRRRYPTPGRAAPAASPPHSYPPPLSMPAPWPEAPGTVTRTRRGASGITRRAGKRPEEQNGKFARRRPAPTPSNLPAVLVTYSTPACAIAAPVMMTATAPRRRSPPRAGSAGPGACGPAGQAGDKGHLGTRAGEETWEGLPSRGLPSGTDGAGWAAPGIARL